MLRVRLVVPVVVAVATVLVGAAAAASASGGSDLASTPPTDPRPTAPPLTAPSAPGTASATTTGPDASAPSDASEPPDVSDPVLDGLPVEARPAILAILGLDESSLDCVSSAFNPFTTQDDEAVQILQSCGVSVAAVARGAADLWVRGQQTFEVTPTTAGVPSDEISVDDAFYVSFMFLVPSDALDCLARDLTDGATDDDAVAVLAACDASIAGIVSGIQTALAGWSVPDESLPTDSEVTTTAVAVTTAPPVTTSADPTAPVPSGVPLDDPAVPVIQDLFAEQGITLTAEQAACIAAGLNTVDTDNMASMAALLDSCQVF